MEQATEELVTKVEAYVSQYMSQFDASHDYRHVQRVLGLAKSIHAQEQKTNPDKEYRSDIITLGSLLHDVGDKKYLKPGQNGETMVQELLMEFGADERLATDVQKIVSHVSYSHEIKNPEKVISCLAQYPELAIVQDADRLDAIGAVGVGRCFAYTAAVGKNSLDVAIVHFEEKLLKLASMMKTASGKQMAVSRTQRLLEFKEWWIDENRTIVNHQ